jgi:hypothetical protein
VRPELAGSGATPQSIAKFASLFSRCGVVAGGDEELPGDLDADPDRIEQLGVELAHELLDRLVEVRDLVVELDDPPGDALERDPGRDDRVGGGVEVSEVAGLVADLVRRGDDRHAQQLQR